MPSCCNIPHRVSFASFTSSEIMEKLLILNKILWKYAYNVYLTNVSVHTPLAACCVPTHVSFATEMRRIWELQWCNDWKALAFFPFWTFQVWGGIWWPSRPVGSPLTFISGAYLESCPIRWDSTGPTPVPRSSPQVRSLSNYLCTSDEFTPSDPWDKVGN